MPQEIIHKIVDTLENFKAENICYFDATHKSSLFDYIVIVTGKNITHTKAIAKHVKHALKKYGFKNKKLSSEQNGEWVVLDLGSILLHIMIQEVREIYRLEELWCNTYNTKHSINVSSDSERIVYCQNANTTNK